MAYDLCGGRVAYGMVACGATLVAVPVASLAWVAPAAPRLTVLITACTYNLELPYYMVFTAIRLLARQHL